MSHRPPGLLRARQEADVLMMICTAGHVDHGKTRLVKLLTGCNTDRLKEEQERGLTIELGFAPCLLEGELCVGIVDVPGHEKFVRNMVAGVSGIDMAVLIVAADDGVMPQTIEHFQIMQLVGVRHGMVAVTKTDMVTPERVEEVVAEVRELVTGTFMDGARICPLSSETLDGFFEFYEGLVAEVKSLQKRRSEHVFRMPILNTFSSEGFGSVVTGIPVDGQIEIGQQVELVPGGQKGRVRGLQRFLRDASEGGYGQCLAVNVPDYGKLQPVRGQSLCLPGYLREAQTFHLEVRVVSGVERPLKNAEEIVFHSGTSEQRGKLYLLEEKTLGAGETGLASIVLANPIAAAVHDKYILRRSSPARTVGGGEIIGATDDGRKTRKKVLLEQLRTYLEFFEGAPATGEARLDLELEYCLRSGGVRDNSLAQLARWTLLTEATTQARLDALLEAGKVTKIAGDSYLHADDYAACLEEATRRVEAAASGAKNLNLSISDLRQGLDWPVSLWTRLQKDLEARELIQRRGDGFVLVDAVRELDDALPEADRALVQKLREVYAETGFQSPRPEELAETLGEPLARIERQLEYLCAREELFRLSKNVVLARDWLRQAQGFVVEDIEANGFLDSADFKGRIGSSRKYAIAILDYLDVRKVTVRRGNDRRLTRDYRANMV